MSMMRARLKAEADQGDAIHPDVQKPDAERYVKYTEFYEQVYRGLYPALKPFFKHLGKR